MNGADGAARIRLAGQASPPDPAAADRTDSAGLTRRGGSGGAAGASAERDSQALLFVAEMYGVQIDQLAVQLGVASRRATEIAARWVSRGHAQTDRLGPGARWVWLTKAGLSACGLAYLATAPALPRLAHMRAVTAVRLALEAVPQYVAGGAHWRGERRLRARLGGRLGSREHLADAEVHWPEFPAGAGAPAPWAGECWAIEAELTPKTVARTAAIMHELLIRTGDYGCLAGEVAAPGHPARYARVIYLCSPAAARTVARARDQLAAGRARIEIRALPPEAYLPAPAGRRSGR